MSTLHVITHPLVQHKLTLMRQKDASTNSFRRLLDELSTLMAYEVTRHMPLQDVEIETPLEIMTGKMIDGKKLVLVSILRAGGRIPRRHVARGPRRPRGAHRAVPRPGHAAAGRVLLQDAVRDERA
jgi:uracil phosphoribosyltransferase